MFRLGLLLVIFLVSSFTAQAVMQEGDDKKEEKVVSDLLSLEGVIDPNSDIPPELLAVDYRMCFEGCQEAGLGANTCTALCACSIREFQTRYAKKSYIALRGQLTLNALDEANRILIGSIQNKCAAEAQKVGLLPPAEPDEDKPVPSKPE